MNSKTSKRWRSVLLGKVKLVAFVSILLFCSYVWALEVNTFFKGLQNSSWPPAIGRIAEAKIVTRHGNEYKATTFYCSVRYDYYVSKKKYVSNRWMIGGRAVENFSTKNLVVAKRFCGKYPVGKQVEVYYDPDDPHRAVLHRGINYRIVYTLSLLGLFIFVIYFILIRELMKKNVE